MTYKQAFLYIKNGITFKSPQKSKVVIFDALGATDLAKLLLGDVSYTTLPVRFERFYFSIPIIVRLLKRLVENTKNPVTLRKSDFFEQYLLACIDFIRPKVVFTINPNNFYFQKIFKKYTDIEFFAIQTGLMTDIDLASKSQLTNGILPEIPKPGSTIELPTFFCLGQRSIDVYSKYGHKIKNFRPVGGLLSGYYKDALAPKSIKLEYDFCLVSQWRKNFQMGSGKSYIRDPMKLRELELANEEYKISQEILHDHLKRYLEKKPGKLIIALATHESEELDYYKTIFGDLAEYGTRERFQIELFSCATYYHMDRSNVIIGFDSTALFEAFGGKKKVLFCNNSPHWYRSCVFDGEWALNQPTFEQFYAALNNLVQMDQFEYEEKSRTSREYYIAANVPTPAYKEIAAFIASVAK